MNLFLGPVLSLILLLIIMGTTFVLLAIVTKRKAVFAAAERTRDSFMTNAALAVFNRTALVPVLILPETYLRQMIHAPEMFSRFWDAAPAALTFIAAVLVYDFAVYWRHRAEHHPLLWRIHATHHADEHLHWLSVLRKHPLAKILEVTFDILLLLFLGFPVWVIAAASVSRTAWAFFIHADVPWTLGPLGWILISPAAHRLHHIRDESLMGYNFGNTVALWDQLFGTYRDPKPYLNCETGIAEGSRDFSGELFRPFEERYRRRPVGGSTTAPPTAA